MKHNAPPILSQLEFDGLVNEFILIEVDPDSQLLETLHGPLSGKINIIFSSSTEFYSGKFDGSSTVIREAKSVYDVYKFMKAINVDVDYFIIDRIDILDSGLSPKEKGAQQNAFLCMISSPLILRDSNLLVTSANQEQTIRKKATRYLNLKN
jgi:hypothetical protein